MQTFQVVQTVQTKQTEYIYLYIVRAHIYLYIVTSPSVSCSYMLLQNW